MNEQIKDYSSISPSAQSLLWMKALTDIPFAREAAKLIFGEAALPTEMDERVTDHFLKRLLHFETRYWSIDAALEMMGISNVLELSSGFSFRGLHKVLHEDAFYIDTDLPQVIEVKETLLKPLLRTLQEHSIGHLTLKPLNVMEAEAFFEIGRRFPPGPLAIINEGLLVYLEEAEKRKLCATIRKLLEQRGGYWITADIYVKNTREETLALAAAVSPSISKFLADHRVEENKFDSFSGAESFFLSCGLRLAHKAVPEINVLKSMEMIKSRAPRGSHTTLVTRQHIRETWILEVLQ